MKVEIVRQKRKTLSIVINSDGVVKARAPKNMSVDTILAFVSQHEALIEERLKEREERKKKEHAYLDGEIFYYLGEGYKLSYYDGDKIGLYGGKLWMPEKYREDAKTKLLAWYKQEAKNLFDRVLKEESKRTGLPFSKFRVSTARTRWGSCNGNSEIGLNYRLISAPEFVIRAVCVHELCHVPHKNHGKDYKHLLHKLCPRYDEAIKYLKTHPMDTMGE